MPRDYQSAERRLTTSGTALLRFLEADTLASAGQLLHQSPTCSELAFQALTILARRKFARNYDANRIRAYVGKVLNEKGSASESRVLHGESLLNSVLFVGSAVPRMPLRHQDMVLAFAVSLFAELDPPGSSSIELIEAAELRLKRLAAKTHGRGIRRRIHFRRFLREMSSRADSIHGAGADPGTPIGNILEAVALYDFERAKGLPDDQNSDRVDAIVGHVFAAIVDYRFEFGQHALDLGDLLVRAAKRTNSPLVTDQVIRKVIGDQIGISGDRLDLDSATTTQAKLSTIVEVVEELGLLPTEIRGFILDAERSYGGAET